MSERNRDLTSHHERARHCVVTGAAGFIGSHLCEELLTAGWSVIGVDAFTDAYAPAEKVRRANQLQHWSNFTLLEADLVALDLESVFVGSEVVFHLAGRAGVRASFGLEERYVHDNVTATERVLRAARASGVRRVVYASSSSVYGDAPTPFLESAPSAPISPYGRTKMLAEEACLAAAGRDLETVALRYFTVYGPRQRPDMGFRLFIEAALANRPITLLGDGTQRRDFTYVSDIVAATIAASAAPASGLALNVGGGCDVSILEVLETLRDLVGHDLLIDERPRARGDVRETAADLSRARDLLDYRPRVSFADGFVREFDWLAQSVPSLAGSPR